MREKIKALLIKSQKHEKAISLIFAAIVVVGGLVFWLNCTHSGWLFKNNMIRQTKPPIEQRDIDVYNDGVKIADYDGLYLVQRQNDSYVIFNPDNGERIDFYGDDVVIIDKTYDNKPEVQE